MMDLTRRTLIASPAALAVAQVEERPIQPGIPRRHLFSKQLPAARLAAQLLPRAEWRPFPRLQDRAAWEALDAGARKGLIEAGEAALAGDWPTLPATLALEYARVGNRSRYEAVRYRRRGRLADLVLAECAEGKGRFLDEIANGIWTTCEETFWGVPAHLGAQKAGVGLADAAEPIVDLFAAETSAQLAWTDYLLGAALDKPSKLLRRRILFECERRLMEPCRTRDDFGWMGLGARINSAMNNWNPWINSNWLTTVLLLEDGAERRAATVAKIATSLDRFADSYYDDGGCDEGPGYWGRAGASLYDCLELLLSASRGRIDFYREPLVGEIGRYVVKAHIAGDWYTNFADASAKARPNGFLVWHYGLRTGDADMQALGAWLAGQPETRRSNTESLGRTLPALFGSAAMKQAPARQPLLRDAWMPGIQVMTARQTAGSEKGFYIAAQGGHNAESHNHNDVGNFMVFLDGQPLLIDIGVETYSAKTFSAKRYEIWTMRSSYHNCPTVGGVEQAAGRQYEATNVRYRSDDAGAEMALDLVKAYPEAAGIQSWQRTLRLDRRAGRIVVSDQYVLTKQAGEIALTLMTVRQPRAAQGGVDLGVARIEYDAALAPKIEEIKVEDGRLRPVWGERVWRIQLVAARPPLTGRFEVRVVR